MRIIPVTSLVVSLVLAFFTLAGAAGFEGPGVMAAVTRAADVLRAADDAPCMLEGHILERIPRRKNRYVFADESGQVVVEIEGKTFGNLTVTPRDKVRLIGEVDWDDKRPNEVEVDLLFLVK